ncbi:zinc ABC transporter substrate-binding protein [Sulfitobacter sp. S0837]|uniref:zinc ABC transporter substrate-binding protein n=1 Tax=Sulfitobacter maritimus TaxID=2741719 RepID=UPI001583FDDE|nr:zinc ABC transporter substrate-binding protein [Sulfitobacter maritimus]NUH64636.1 zinc ABC transporter substrate-binding protein [Sulfitobacter maritimus]
MFRFTLPAAVLVATSAPVWAEAPAVATDIAPVQALVAQVMAGVGAPALIVPPRASPHGYAMRPSEARALSGADLVVWVGPALTPWLAEPLTTLAGNAEHLELMSQPGTQVLAFRQGARFEAHDHGAEGVPHGADAHEEHEEDHAHDDAGHAGHAHDDADYARHAEDGADHEGHAHDVADHAGHTHEGVDPHVWLDPRNGQLWLGEIAGALAELDPENAAQYRANAAAAQAELVELETEIAERLAPVKDQPFIVFHDAYHYFEARFDIEAIGAISENDARAPGAARVAALREMVQDSGVKCVFAEPQFNPGLIAAVSEGQGVKTGTLDPIGAELTPGATLYSDLLRGMAESMAACLSD